MALQHRILPAYPVQPGDLADDVPRRPVIALAQLVLLGIKVFLLARHRLGFAQLEPRVHAPESRAGRRQHRADEEAGPPRALEEVRVDIRGVDEEVRSVAVAQGRRVELFEVALQLRLGVAPGEVGVALAEARLAQARHHRGAGEGFGEENHLGMIAANLGDQPFPEWQRLGVRVVDAEQRHALLHPPLYDVQQRQPKVGDGLRGIEIDIDDILVFLGWILRVANAAVGTPAEPAGMLTQPWMVRRTLDSEIQGDFQAVIVRRRHQRAEICQAAQLWMHCVMTALLAADGIRAAGVVRARQQTVVRPLAMGTADGMDRREVDYVEAHRGDFRQAPANVGEAAVAAGLRAFRAGEEFVPAGESGQLALDVQRIGDAAGEMRAVLGLLHHFQRVRRHQQCQALFALRCLVQLLKDGGQSRRAIPRRSMHDVAQQFGTFTQFQVHGLAGGVLLLQVMAVAGVAVDPGQDDELGPPFAHRQELRLPVIVALPLHRQPAPLCLADIPPGDFRLQLLMAVHEDARTYAGEAPAQRLRGEPPAFELRLDILDRDTRSVGGGFGTALGSAGGFHVHRGPSCSGLCMGAISGQATTEIPSPVRRAKFRAIARAVRRRSGSLRPAAGLAWARGGRGGAALGPAALALQAALEQFGEVDDVGAFAGRFPLGRRNFLQLALGGLLLDQALDLFAEGVLVVVRVPLAAHVGDQPLGHLQLALLQRDIAQVQVEAFEAPDFGGPAQGHQQQPVVLHHQRGEVLAAMHHQLADRDPVAFLQRFPQQHVDLFAATVGRQVIGGIEVGNGNLLPFDELQDVDRLGGLRPGGADFLFAEDHIAALLVFHSLDDMFLGHLLAADLVHPFVADRFEAAFIQPVEVGSARAAGAVERHRDMHQAETDRPFPDHSRHHFPPRGSRPLIRMTRAAADGLQNPLAGSIRHDFPGLAGCTRPRWARWPVLL
ncbi:hypothetical protein D3C76_676530 [compost metagenome]